MKGKPLKCLATPPTIEPGPVHHVTSHEGQTVEEVLGNFVHHLIQAPVHHVTSHEGQTTEEVLDNLVNQPWGGT